MRLLLSSCFLAAWASVARAQEPPPIDGNDFAIDAVATPVLASSRITGLAGAYTALADGIDGVPWNPAGYASRTLWELDRVEYDLTASLLLGGSFGENDYFLHGRGSVFGIEDVAFVDLGARLQFGPIGAGALFQIQSYTVPEREDGTPAASVSLMSIHGGAGYGLYDGQLVIGGGARGILFDTRILGAEEAFALSGVGLEVGSVFRHERLPFRVGAAFRTPVRSTVEDLETGETPTQVAGLWRPERVELPWEVQAGFAIQLGPRPLNRRYRPKKDVSRGLRAERKRGSAGAPSLGGLAGGEGASTPSSYLAVGRASSPTAPTGSDKRRKLLIHRASGPEVGPTRCGRKVRGSGCAEGAGQGSSGRVAGASSAPPAQVRCGGPRAARGHRWWGRAHRASARWRVSPGRCAA